MEPHSMMIVMFVPAVLRYMRQTQIKTVPVSVLETVISTIADSVHLRTTLTGQWIVPVFVLVII